MPLYSLRIWLPDRPGALGLVASRLGAVNGDLVGIDILERGAGRAIDELIVELPDSSVVSALLKELATVDGVDVEDIRPIDSLIHDPRLDALTSAVALVGADSVDSLLQSLVRNAVRDFDAEWASIIDVEHSRSGGASFASVGPTPDPAWLKAFIEGSQASLAAAVDDVIWVPMSASDLTLLIGRTGRPLRARERRQATALAQIADTRWLELTRRSL